MIDPELEKAFKRRMTGGERLLYAARSNTRQYNRLALIPTLIMSVVIGVLVMRFFQTQNADNMFVILILMLFWLPFFIWAKSPRWEKHFLTNYRIVVDMPVNKYETFIADIRTLKYAGWAGKNCISISTSRVLKLKGIPVAGNWGMNILHGVADPEEFLKIFYNEEQDV